jgi:Ca-activated chloride channel family protein
MPSSIVVNVGFPDYRQVEIMLQLEWPWLLLCLPLPALVYRYLPPFPVRQDAALRVPFIDDFQLKQSSQRVLRKNRAIAILAILAWCLLVFSAARPQWMGDSIEIPVSGRDLMIALDLSESMSTGDFEINGERVHRLHATQWVAEAFINRRKGDRVGLILFGEQAYLQVPLTFDIETVKKLLLEAVINLAGKRTAIGDAIGLAIKRLENSPQSSRVLILMTDGQNTAGTVDPIKAAELAASRGLKIYTIGIGGKHSRDLDIVTLKKIADLTSGRFFRATKTEELEDIYALLDQFEVIDSDHRNFRPVIALFYWPLAIALLLATFVHLIRLRPVL